MGIVAAGSGGKQIAQVDSFWHDTARDRLLTRAERPVVRIGANTRAAIVQHAAACERGKNEVERQVARGVRTGGPCS